MGTQVKVGKYRFGPGWVVLKAIRQSANGSFDYSAQGIPEIEVGLDYRSDGWGKLTVVSDGRVAISLFVGGVLLCVFAVVIESHLSHSPKDGAQ